MTARISTPLPLDDGSMWRKAMALHHPDRGGSYEGFVWIQAVRDFVCEGSKDVAPPRQSDPPRQQPPAHEPDAVPFDPGADFDALTRRALDMARTLPEPYRGLLRLLSDCEGVNFGPLRGQQQVGASYRALAAAGHAAGLNRRQRSVWYRIAEEVPLARRHCGHLLSRLKQGHAA